MEQESEQDSRTWVQRLESLYTKCLLLARLIQWKDNKQSDDCRWHLNRSGRSRVREVNGAKNAQCLPVQCFGLLPLSRAILLVIDY